MGDPQVIAAGIAAAAALLAAVMAWRSSRSASRIQVTSIERTIEAQLVVAALSHLVGGSQESVGPKSEPQDWQP